MKREKIYEGLWLLLFVVIMTLMASTVIIDNIPNISFIKLPYVDLRITTLHIPILIAVVLKDRRFGLYLGLLFGIFSMISGFYPTGNETEVAIQELFKNPLISVLPRILFGAFAYYLWTYFKKLFQKDWLGYTLLAVTLSGVGYLIYRFAMYELEIPIAGSIAITVLIVALLGYLYFKVESVTASMFLTGLIATLLHSVMVLTMLALIYSKFILEITGSESIINWASGVIFTNALIEAVIAAIITPIIARPIISYVTGKKVTEYKETTDVVEKDIKKENKRLDSIKNKLKSIKKDKSAKKESKPVTESTNKEVLES